MAEAVFTGEEHNKMAYVTDDGVILLNSKHDLFPQAKADLMKVCKMSTEQLLSMSMQARKKNGTCTPFYSAASVELSRRKAAKLLKTE